MICAALKITVNSELRKLDFKFDHEGPPRHLPVLVSTAQQGSRQSRPCEEPGVDRTYHCGTMVLVRMTQTHSTL
ncbi:hypothetical protein J4Q44_G00154490 [Coregonus suidteri]|uniref:Uncharacterized protein n=1 Tax=Coregonus suidteri TaxID=861788 RepID=A0AAN8LX41_9TELE